MSPTTARRLFCPLAALALALSASLAWAQAPVAAAADAGRAGTFKQVQGEVRLGKDGTRSAPQSGDAVRSGERIATGRDGAASVVLKDGTVLTLGPNTTADLSQFQYDATTQEGNFALDLLQGSLRVVTGLLAKINPDRFKVKTPTAVVGVRGTDFIVEAAPKLEPLQFYLNHHWRDHSRLRR
ncbi:FecR domain-containing protein [Hydrogenophaga sp. RWCD_12]|uniref:FecR family protein n=1 Tax=Hydrogenophaga sp. RWCD_12 TaxID=3391190 RepID=UPI0039856337